MILFGSQLLILRCQSILECITKNLNDRWIWQTVNPLLWRITYFNPVSGLCTLTHEHSHLCAVQESIDSVDVGVGPYHYSMGGDSGQVTVSVLCDLGFGALRTQQLEICRLEIHGPRFTRDTWTKTQGEVVNYVPWNHETSKGKILYLGVTLLVTLTISVLEDSWMLDESHISLSTRQTPEWTDMCSVWHKFM